MTDPNTWIPFGILTAFFLALFGYAYSQQPEGSADRRIAARILVCIPLWPVAVALAVPAVVILFLWIAVTHIRPVFRDAFGKASK